MINNKIAEIIDELEKTKIPGGTLDKYLDIYCKTIEQSISAPDDFIANPRIYITFKYFDDNGIDNPFVSEEEKEKTLKLCKSLEENDEYDMLQVIGDTIELIMNGDFDF